MQQLTLWMLFSVTTFDFFARGDYWGRWAILPGAFQYTPELMGLIAAIIVAFAGTRNRFQYVRAVYWVIFGALLVTIVFGALINHVDAGPIFAGTRNYLRAIPWFLLPAVVAFTNDQVKWQLKVLLAISLLQVPFAVQQRLTTTARGHVTGDFISGTLTGSGTMSIFLIGSTCIAVAMVVRGAMKRWQFITIFLLLLLPTTINETKASLLLLPFCLLIALLVASQPGRRLRAVLVVSALVSGFVAIYLPIYDHYNSQRQYAVPVLELLTDQERLKGYLWKTEDVGANVRAGRVDSIVVPFNRMKQDPTLLAFGFGIGNVSDSALGQQFVGAQFKTYGLYLVTAGGRLLLEIGLFGIALVFVLLWQIYTDCRIVCRRDEGLISSLAAGWVGVVVLMALATFYTDTIVHTSLSFVFWYLSGLIAASRMRGLTSQEPLVRPAVAR